MRPILVGKIDLLAPVFLSAGHFDDGHCGCFDEFYILYVLFHLLLH